MPTISAYTSDQLKRRIDRIVRDEGRNQAQVGSTALELYAALPPAARRAFIELLAAEDEAGRALLDRAIADAARALLSAKWDLLSQQMIEEGKSRSELSRRDMSEEEIAALSVELTSRSKRRGRRAG